MPITKHTRNRSPLRAISYVRVSTKEQGESGIGLEGQLVAIREYAEREGYEIIANFEDVCSGAGRLNFSKRSGLKNALTIAKQNHIPILINDASRLARNSDVFLSICSNAGVKIISIAEGALVSPAQCEALGKRSQFEREEISKRTKVALSKLKDKGVKLGNRTNLPEAREKAIQSNRNRAEETANKIADVLEEIEDKKFTAGQIADLLNERGILSGQGRKLTSDTVRRPLRRARQILKERQKKHYENNPNFGRFA